MNQKSPEFSKSDLMKMLRDPQTQALIQRLQQLDGEAIRAAASAASSGNTDRAKELLNPLLQDDEVKRITEQMRNSHGGI